ncbi:MAG: AarF/UbiB family protein [Planctomycetota bacterium]
MNTGTLSRGIRYAGMAVDLGRIARTHDETVRDNARRHLAQRMGRLHGLPQKLGQMLAMSDDAEKADPFAGLGERAEPIPFDVVRPLLERAWGEPITKVVRAIDESGLAASLGQVHRAALLDGTEVAVKVAYPGIREAVAADLKMLGWLSSPVGDLRRGFDLSAYRAEIARDLDEELDYLREQQNQTRYATLAAPDHVVVPRCFSQWSGSSVLVTAWEDGDSLEKTINWPVSAREELARRLLGHFLTMLFDHGLVHADPHPGNYRFRDDRAAGPRLVLYDFGSLLEVSPVDRLALLRLIRESAQCVGDPLPWLISLGFSPALLTPIADKLPAVCKILFEPFSHPGKFDPRSWRRRERMDDVLADGRWNFRMAGPARLILLMRAFRGVLFYLDRLQAQISWSRILEPILHRHATELDRLTPPPTATTGSGFGLLAKHLCIDVRRDGKRTVFLTLPADAVDDLAEVMGDETAERVLARGIDLDAIAASARRQGYKPMTLFALDDPTDAKSVRVWLE